VTEDTQDEEYPAKRVSGSPTLGYTAPDGSQVELSAEGGWLRPRNATEAALVDQHLATQEDLEAAAAGAAPDEKTASGPDTTPAPTTTTTEPTKTAGKATSGQEA
jgi:hypothetical protein